MTAKIERPILVTVPTGRESDKFMLRLPDGMRSRIKAAAESNNRSMNAEIVATLEAAYPAPKEEISARALTLIGQIFTVSPDQVDHLLRDLNAELEKGPTKMVAKLSHGQLTLALPDLPQEAATALLRAASLEDSASSLSLDQVQHMLALLKAEISRRRG